MSTPSIFSDVQDSPLFRLRAAELEGWAETLQIRTKTLSKGGRRYSDGLERSFQASVEFADCLDCFCGEGTDEESAAIGGPLMMRFAHALRELSSFTELLRTQVEMLLCGQLQESINKLTAEVKDARQRVGRCTAEYDAARARHLGHAKSRPSWPTSKASVPERTHADMLAARAAAEDARFDLVRKLAEVQARRKYAYIEAVASVMQAHITYFQHGASALQSLAPYLDETLNFADRLKGDAATQQAMLEEMIQAQLKQADEARNGGLVSVESSPTGVTNDDPASSDAVASGAQASGPLQMSAVTVKLAAELDVYMRVTQESQGAHVTVLHQGYLLKQSSKMKSKWQRRFFVLDSLGMLYYYSTKGERSGLAGIVGKDLAGRDQHPHTTVLLLTSTVKPGPPEGLAVPFSFRVVSPEREYVLQAEDEAEAREWIEVLQSTIACLLTGVISTEARSVPKRPTHTRMASVDLSAATAADLAPAPEPVPESEDVVASFFVDTYSTTSSPNRASKEPSFVLASPLPSPPRPMPHSAAPTATLSPLEVLRSVAPGNGHCADCGAAGPEWGSLNLGTVLCIECSGFHRQLGVHISKVRSLTLDVRAWGPPMVALFSALGNTRANGVWEEELAAQATISAQVQEQGVTDTSGRDGPAGVLKPGPASPAAAKQAFIRAKYADTRFVAGPKDEAGLLVGPQQMAHTLWAAAGSGDILAAYRALVGGADVNHAFNSSDAAQLAWECNLQAGGAQDEPLSPTNLRETGVLHAASRRGDVAMMELLLQWGAEVEACDVFGRTPLGYALLYDELDVAKQLLRRGASAGVQDCTGAPALQWATGPRCGSDDHLAALLRKSA